MFLTPKITVFAFSFGKLRGVGGLPRTSAGFTLIEAMITMGLLAIIMAIAIPSYTNYVIRANRTEALQVLMTMAACQERIYARSNGYDATVCGDTSAGDSYAYSTVTSNGALNFVASASPQGGQLEDICGSLSIDQAGTKNAGGQSDNFAIACWKGR